MSKSNKQYKIVAFYDSETNNREDLIHGHIAYPILHQLGVIKYSNMLLKDITVSNVKDMLEIKLVRHTSEVCVLLDALPRIFANENIVPVVCIHNLSFDMYALSDWLSTKEVKVLAKSATKPISFTILNDEGAPELVLWDTMQFSGKSLERMGNDCGMPKLIGQWNYNLQRTTETVLTKQELEYAKHDIYTLAVWLGFWCRNNPDIDESRLALNVTTKTGIVREKRRILFDSVKGKNSKYNIGRFWLYQNRKEQPKTDDELFTMQACTRGGFTFTASKFASKVFDLSNGYKVFGYDATSMHPSMMCSHAYPEQFKEVNTNVLMYASRTIMHTSIDYVIDNWYKPFPVAFNACFRLTNLRPKENSLYAKYGIYPLAYARISEQKTTPNEDNGSQDLFIDRMRELGYKDHAINPVYNFGKLVSCDECELYLTELAFWEVCQCYEFDNVEPIHGYLTNRFAKPTDMSIISVMHFYTAKRVIKDAVIEYEKNGRITNKQELIRYVPEWLANGAENGTVSIDDIKLELLSAKQSLNGLFGVECTNEFRDDTVLTNAGIEYVGNAGLVNAPKNPKSWYQFGQRIVGWSRILQHVAMQLINPYVGGIICGDTDSIKIFANEDNISRVDAALSRINKSIDKAKYACTSRIRRNYPEYYDELKGIGYYIQEFAVTNFCAAWNKAYLIKDEHGYSFTIAGITTNKRYKDAAGNVFNNSYNDLAEYLEEHGYTFNDICNLLLGYNVQIDSSITKINGRKAPEWASNVFGTFTDYLGESALVAEPASLALFNMPKLIGGQDNKENYYNLQIALKNNSNVNTSYVLLRWFAGFEPDIITL